MIDAVSSISENKIPKWMSRVSITLSDLIRAYINTESIFPEVGDTLRYGIPERDAIEFLGKLDLHNDQLHSRKIKAMIVVNGTKNYEKMRDFYDGASWKRQRQEQIDHLHSLGISSNRESVGVTKYLYIAADDDGTEMSPTDIMHAVNLLDEICFERNDLVSYLVDTYRKAEEKGSKK